MSEANVLRFPSDRKKPYENPSRWWEQPLPANVRRLNPKPYRPRRDPELDGPPRYTQSGRMLPLTHRWRRIALSTHHATRAWKTLAHELSEATDRIITAEATRDPEQLEAAVDRFRTVALAVLKCNTGNSWDLRAKLALVAWMAGARDPRFLHPEDDPTATESALARFDMVLMAHARAEPERLAKAARRLAMKRR